MAVAIRSVAGGVEAEEDPLSVIFASRPIIVAARVVVLFVAFYIVASIIAHVAARQWLTGIGPVQIGESVRALKEQRDSLLAALSDAEREIAHLEREYSEVVERLERTLAERNEALAQLAKVGERSAGEER